MTILQGGKQETSRTFPASGKRRALLLVKGNRPGRKRMVSTTDHRQYLKTVADKLDREWEAQFGRKQAVC